jgi:hypothetical protein
VPQQALYLMNHPFAATQAESLARSAEFREIESVGERVRFLYRRLFSREPEDVEVAAAAEFLGGTSADEAVWRGYIQALYCTNEFAFTD